MIPVDDAESLSRLFHLNSEPWLNEDAYRSANFHHEYKEHPDAIARISLPQPEQSRLTTLIAGRQSTRAFADWTMPLAILSKLVFATYGGVEIAPLESTGTYLRRSVPSAGALYPLEIFLLIRNVENLDAGLYHYDVRSHALEQINAEDWTGQAKNAFYTFPFIHDANVVVCHAAVFSRCQTKYGPRGYRYILLEAGHSAQNLCLAAQDLSLATLCMGGFKDAVLNRMLGLDMPAEGVVYSVAVGKTG